MKGKITAIALVILCIQCLTSSLIARVEAETSSLLQYPGNWCLDFDGEDDYVTCGSSSLFRLSILTIEAWVRPKYMIMEGSNSEYGHTHGFIISRRSSVFLTSGFGFVFDYANGCLVFAFRSGSYSFSHHTDRSVWHNTSCYHIAVTYDRTQPSDNLKVLRERHS